MTTYNNPLGMSMMTALTFAAVVFLYPAVALLLQAIQNGKANQ